MRKGVTRLPFRADSRSGRARPMPKSNSVRAHPKAALRPAVASGCCRRAPPPPIAKSQTENSGGPRRRPASATRATRIGRAPFGARTPTDQEPDHPPEMPERTHATATPRPAVSIGSRRTVPIAARRRRRIETAGRGAALARARKRAQRCNAAPFPSKFKERSRSADAKIQQRASTSEGCPAASCCERLLPKSSATADRQVPNRKQRRASPSASIGDQGDQDWPRAVRRPHAHGSEPDHPA